MENGLGSLMSESARSSIRRARTWGGTAARWAPQAFLRHWRQISQTAASSSRTAAMENIQSHTLGILISGLTVSLKTSGAALEAGAAGPE